MFDPSFVAENAAKIDAAWVRKLEDIIPIAQHGISDGAVSQHGDADCDDDHELSFVSKLERDLPLYLAAARDFTCNHADVGEFTKAVLGWWKNHGAEVGAWAIGAQIVFSFTPNSASAERIFSLMKDMFGLKQAGVLADILQASMMLRYHKRLARATRA